MTIPVAILGATGYTGAELIRLLDNHPDFEVAHLGAHSQAGKLATDVLPGCAGATGSMTLAAADAALPDDVELAFTALPHGAAANSVKQALDGVFGFPPHQNLQSTLKIWYSIKRAS